MKIRSAALAFVLLVVASVASAQAIGTPGQAWNPPFWNRAREMAWHALTLNSYVEVVVVDSWLLKHAQWGDQPATWPQEDVDACGRRPSPEQERFIRKVVSEMGCFGNVVWMTDNEGGEIQGEQRAWYEWVHGVIRDEEQKSGCGFVHMIGTNTPKYGDGPFDYVATHARSPLTEPIAGKWTINNERNPSFSPEQEASNHAEARKRGLAWMYWRAEMSDEDQVKTLGLFRDVIAGSAQVGCFAPEPEDPLWVGNNLPQWIGPNDSRWVPQATQWLNEAKAIVGDPLLMPGATVWDRKLEADRRLSEALRKAGHCASGPWKDAVVLKVPQAGQVGIWVEFHAVTTTDGGYAGSPWKGSLWQYGSQP